LAGIERYSSKAIPSGFCSFLCEVKSIPMRFSTIVTGSTAVAAAVVLAACGGHGVVPSQSFASGGSGVSNDLLANAQKSPCQVAKMYFFHGNCRAFTLSMTKNTVVKLGQFGAYHGIKITTTFSPNSGGPKTGGVAAIMGDADGKGDITGTVGGKAFKLYGDGKDCVYAGKPATCPGKPFVYAELINTSQYTLKPQKTPGFYITDDNGFPGTKACFPAELTSKGWLPETNLTGKPKGKTLTINAVSNTGNLYYPAHSQFIVAGVCE
jgi:hypothetical protein